MIHCIDTEDTKKTKAFLPQIKRMDTDKTNHLHFHLCSSVFICGLFLLSVLCASAVNNVKLTGGIVAKKAQKAVDRVYRLGVCSDTHGHTAPAFDAASVSAVLHAGDLYDAANRDSLPRDPMTLWLAKCPAPVFLVRGNHDYWDHHEVFERYNDVTGHIREIAPRLFVAGVGFCRRRYYDLPGETDLQPVCRDVLRSARRLIGTSDRIVLLTHYPAKFPAIYPAEEGPLGWAFECVRELIEELRPIAVVQGHVHEWFGQTHTVEVSGRQVLLLHPGPLGGILRIDTDSSTASYAAAK
jgi:Icc-related predicted phosphoesterase